MPEGDTVYRACAQLDAALAGRELVRAELRWPGLSTAQLAGQTVTEVVPYGKHLLTRLDSGWTLHSHLKMEGQWRIEATIPDEPPAGVRPTTASPRGPAQPGRPQSRRSATTWAGVRAILANSEWTAIGLRLGRLDLVRTIAEAHLVGHLGPDILASGFDAGDAVANLRAADTTIGAALLDQRNLAGIGTFWASEALFQQRTPPWTAAADLAEEQLFGIVERARRQMLASLPFGVPSTTGSRRPGESNYVHGRSGRPCRRCGGQVRVATIGPPTQERTMFYCPSCQGGLAPTDAGGPIAPLGATKRSPRI